MSLYLGEDAGTRRHVELPLESLRRGCYVIGTPGGGKTTLLRCLLSQFADLDQPYGLIDPEGALYRHAIFEASRNWDPEGDQLDVARTVTINTSDAQCSVPMNVCLVPQGVEPEDHVDSLMLAFHRAFEDSWGMRLADFLRHGLLIAAEFRLSLYEVLLLAIFPEYRLALAKASKNPMLKAYFIGHLDLLKGYELRAWLEAVRNKLAPFILSPHLKPMLCRDSCIDVLNALEVWKKSFLVHPDQSTLHESAGLFAMLFTSLLEEAVRRRPENTASLWPLVVDEFQMAASKSLIELATRGRKRGVGCVLSHQTLCQPPFDKDRGFIETILGTCHTFVAFRCKRDDAERLAKQMFEVSGERVKVRERHFLWGDTGKTTFWTPQEQWEHWTRCLQDQGEGECYVSLQTGEITTYPVEVYHPPESEWDSKADEFLDFCRAVHGSPRALALEDIDKRAERLYRDHGVKPPALLQTVDEIPDDLDPPVANPRRRRTRR